MTGHDVDRIGLGLDGGDQIGHQLGAGFLHVELLLGHGVHPVQHGLLGKQDDGGSIDDRGHGEPVPFL